MTSNEVLAMYETLAGLTANMSAAAQSNEAQDCPDQADHGQRPRHPRLYRAMDAQGRRADERRALIRVQLIQT